jgi:asparagine synthase (glutamine-hydrolysing)
MSGIAGILHFDANAALVSELDRVASILRPYGPDRSSVAVAGPVGFVNVLMRMTPEDQFDCQPYTSESGAMITADVRLDNRDEVLARIGVTKEVTKEWPDSRIVLTAWERFGDEIWQSLRGPFAVAIWEPRSFVLTLARDHLGLNVLMWYKCDRFLAFSSMPKGLFAFAGVPRRLNEEKFADFLVLNHCDLATTVYQDVFRVLPAHNVWVGVNGSMRQRRYWSSAHIKAIRLSSDQAYADGLRDHLQIAVRRQMRSAHPIGCFLSGGLDSSSIAALAALALRERGERLSAFTHVPRKGFNGPAQRGCYPDETPYVEAIIEFCKNIDVTYVRNDACDDFAALERIFVALDGPVRNPMNLGWMLAIRNSARTQDRRVMFGGRHGNFAVSWDGWSQVSGHFRRGRLIKVYRQWLLFYRSTSLSRWGAFRKLVFEPLLPAKVENWFSRKQKPDRISPWQALSPIHPKAASLFGVEQRAASVGHDFLDRWRPERRERAMALADFEGDWAQAMKAVTGVEVRDPTADVDVVSYCLAVPPEQFLVEGIDRSLIRRALWGLLPEIVLTKRLRGMQSADWYEKLTLQRDGIASEVAALSASPLARRFIDFDRLAQALADWPVDDWHTSKIEQEYRFVLARGFAVARFLAWLEALEG